MNREGRAKEARRGSSLHIVALGFPVLIGAVAMGTDWGLVAVARFQVQAAADEGALAAASALATRPRTPEQIAVAQALAESRAAQYAAKIQVNSLTPAASTVTLGRYDGTWSTTWAAGEAPNAVEVLAEAHVPMTFSRLFGIDYVAVRARAKAGPNVVPQRAPDLVIVQDVTPSMSSTDIAYAKSANSTLVDCIQTYATSDTRGAFVKFANVDRTVVPLVSYEASPNTLYDAASGTTSSAYSSSEVCKGSGGCTNHSAGMYSAVSLLDAATRPPDGVGQAIIFITDGALYSGGSECTSAVYDSTPSTPYKTWLKSQCTGVSAHTTQTACQDAGGVWKSTATPRCRAADNGAEAATNMTPGKCSKLGYLTEARCEGNGGVWERTTSTTPNPSLLTRWTDTTRELAAAGTWGPIDVYAVYYSADASAAYTSDNLTFLANHVVRGKGADLGVLDAPSGVDLLAALEDVCLAYTAGAVGLIE